MSFKDWDNSGRGSGTEDGKSRGFFLSPVTLDCLYTFLGMNFAVAQKNSKDVIVRLANAFINVDDFVRCSMLRSKTLSSAPFYAVFIRTCSKNWKDAVLKPSFADSKPMRSASENDSSATFGIAASTLLL